MYLPAISHRKKKTLIKDEKLRRLCKESHEAWIKWKRVQADHLKAPYMRRNVPVRGWFVRELPIVVPDWNVQRFKLVTLMCKENNHDHFKYPQNRYDDQIKTDPVEIASHFKEFYTNLCSSSPSQTLKIDPFGITSLILRLMLLKLREP